MKLKDPRWPDLTQRQRVELMSIVDRCIDALHYIELGRSDRRRVRDLLAEALHAFPESRIERKDFSLRGITVPFDHDCAPVPIESMRREAKQLLRSDFDDL